MAKKKWYGSEEQRDRDDEKRRDLHRKQHRKHKRTWKARMDKGEDT